MGSQAGPGPLPSRSLLSPAWSQAAHVWLLGLGAGPVRPVQGRELAAARLSGGPVWHLPEALPEAPSLPLRRGRIPYLPVSEATLVAGGHLLALKPSTPAQSWRWWGGFYGGQEAPFSVVCWALPPWVCRDGLAHCARRALPPWGQGGGHVGGATPLLASPRGGLS